MAAAAPSSSSVLGSSSSATAAAAIWAGGTAISARCCSLFWSPWLVPASPPCKRSSNKAEAAPLLPHHHCCQLLRQDFDGQLQAGLGVQAHHMPASTLQGAGQGRAGEQAGEQVLSQVRRGGEQPPALCPHRRRCPHAHTCRMRSCAASAPSGSPRLLLRSSCVCGSRIRMASCRFSSLPFRGSCACVAAGTARRLRLWVLAALRCGSGLL